VANLCTSLISSAHGRLQLARDRESIVDKY